MKRLIPHIVIALLALQCLGCAWSYTASVRAPIGDPASGEIVCSVQGGGR